MTERDCCKCTYSDKEEGLTRYSNGEAVFCGHSEVVQNEEWMGIAVARTKANKCPHYAERDFCTRDEWPGCDPECPFREESEIGVD